MCGIAGFVSFDGQRDIQNTVRSMTSKLRHRGPNASGVSDIIEGCLALGHARLSILDLSENGAQPMRSPYGRYIMTYNGEIYNFQEIRARCENEGVKFKGSSDTEALLGAFDIWGIPNTLKLLDGMFAIGIWDTVEKTLTLIRDRIGEKPLYYGWTHAGFCFASELKALDQFSSRTIDTSAIQEYVQFSAIPSPLSIYTDIHKLPPSTYLTLRLTDLQTKPTSYRVNGGSSGISETGPIFYWNIEQVALQGSSLQFQGTYEEAQNRLDYLLKRSIRTRMLADVSVGAFLSGGIDSSLVVSIMQEESSRPVRTFSIGFQEESYNEAEFASGVSRQLGCEHTELYVTPKDVMSIIPNLSHMYDEPFADSSQIPTYFVCKLAQQYVTVVLSGDGGDELFCGYNRYAWANDINKRFFWLNASSRKALGSILASISTMSWQRASTILKPFIGEANSDRFGHRMHRLAGILNSTDCFTMYKGLLTHWSPKEIMRDALMTEPQGISKALSKLPFLRAPMLLDQMRYLPEDILVKVDRAAMAVSLETRMPFLDYRLAEFSWSLPNEMIYNGQEKKRLLKSLLYTKIPRELVDRPKMGFGLPIDKWLRGPLREWAEDLLSASCIERVGLLNTSTVRSTWEDFIKQGREWDQLLWDILMLQAWALARK